MKNIKQFIKTLSGATLLFLTSTSFADGIEQTTQSYTDLNIVGDFEQNERLKWLLYTEGVWNIDNPNNSNVFDNAMFRGGLGYAIAPNLTFWAAYSFIVDNPESSNNEYENRLHEQLTWVIGDLADITFVSSSRIEQRLYSESSEVALRYRQTLQAVFPSFSQYNLTPVVFDEVYIPINHPNWVDSSTISENDIFAGIEIPTSEDTAFTVGYMNQYNFDAGGENSMNHIIYFIFDIAA